MDRLIYWNKVIIKQSVKNILTIADDFMIKQSDTLWQKLLHLSQWGNKVGVATTQSIKKQSFSTISIPYGNLVANRCYCFQQGILLEQLFLQTKIHMLRLWSLCRGLFTFSSVMYEKNVVSACSPEGGHADTRYGHFTSSSGMSVTQTSWTMSVQPASRRTAASTTHTCLPGEDKVSQMIGKEVSSIPLH